MEPAWTYSARRTAQGRGPPLPRSLVRFRLLYRCTASGWGSETRTSAVPLASARAIATSPSTMSSSIWSSTLVPIRVRICSPSSMTTVACGDAILLSGRRHARAQFGGARRPLPIPNDRGAGVWARRLRVTSRHFSSVYFMADADSVRLASARRAGLASRPVPPLGASADSDHWAPAP